MVMYPYMQILLISHSKVRIDMSESVGDTVGGTIVLFLPGISGKALSDRFLPLVTMVNEMGYSIARMEAWKDAGDVNTMTLRFLQNEILAVIEYLKGEGYTCIYAIGKSFGGGLLLSLHHEVLVKKILWAPAYMVDKEPREKGNMVEMGDEVFGNLQGDAGIVLSQDFVHEDSADLYIVHGTADTVMSLDNSQTIIALAHTGSLRILEGATHSFKTPEEERALMSATGEFLRV